MYDLFKKGAILAIFLLVSVVLVDAQTSFTAQAGVSSGEICRGSTQVFPVTVDGSGSFTVNLEGGASSWSVAVPAGFKSQGKQVVFVYATPHSRVLPGAYTLNVLVSSQGNVQKVPLALTVQNCNDFSIIPATLEQTTCGCEKSAQYTYGIENKGNFADTYQLSLQSSVQDWLTLSTGQITLQPQERKNVVVTVQPACGMYGNQVFTLNVASLGTGQVSSVDAVIKVNNCYDYKLVAEKDSVEMCERTAESVPLLFENTADQSNTYTLSIVGPAWANLESSRLSLGSGTRGTAQLLLTPDFSVEGMFDVFVTAESDQGKVKQEQQISVRVKNCHAFTVDILSEQGQLCASGEKSFAVAVVNTGEVDKDVSLKSSLSWVDLSGESVSVAAGETVTVEALARTGNQSSGKYTLSITGTAVDASKQTAEDFLVLDVVDKESCFAVSVEGEDLRLSRESSATLPFRIIHTGLEAGEYVLSVSGDAASFSQVNPGVITVDAGNSETVYVYVAPSRAVNLGEYLLQFNVENDQGNVFATQKVTITVQEPAEDSLTGLTPVVEEEGKNVFSRVGDWFRRAFGSSDEEVTGDTVVEEPEAGEDLNKTDEVEIEVLEETEPSEEDVAEVPEEVLDEEETDTGVVQEPEVEETPVEEPETVEEPEEEESGLPEVDLRYNPVITEDVQFAFDDETHTLKIDAVRENSITVVIESDPQQLDLMVNESKEVDLNADGRNDILVTLEGIDENGDPRLMVVQLEQDKSYTNFIIIGIIILVVIILLSIFVFREKDEDLEGGVEPVVKEESVKEKPVAKEEKIEHVDAELENLDKIPVGRYVLGVLVLAVLIWLGFRYDFWSAVGVYKFYILLGVIILIILILIIKYWKSITDFFEEEDDFEEEKKDTDAIKKAVTGEEKKEKPKKKKPGKSKRKSVAG